MSETSPTVGHICGIGRHGDWMKDALKRPGLCARCYSITADRECLQRAISAEGFTLQTPLRTLIHVVDAGSCRMCSIFLCIALHSIKDASLFSWPVAEFLDANDAAVASLQLRAILRPEGLSKSSHDIHEILINGSIESRAIPVRDLMDNHLRFKTYAWSGNPAASYISSVAYDSDLHSDAAYSKIRSWITSCETHHPSCPSAASHLPTRVLDLSMQDKANPNTVKLRITRGERGRYATLSYCWGNDRQYKTILSSLNGNTNHDVCGGVAVPSLPLTIQDAITVARQIGLQYLWVDSLCIIQDSVDDMNIELGKMAQIYSDSHVAIVAASASSSDEGFLARKVPRGLEEESVPYQFTLPIASPDGRVDVIGAEYCFWDSKISPEPLDRRGWAFQEHILSRRVLIYGTSTLTWRCEQGPQPWNSWLRPQQKVMPRILLPGHGRRDLYKELWKNLVAMYARRTSTFSEDKLPAIAALADQVLHLSIEGGGDPGKYLAGIWEHDLLEQLIWFADLEVSRDVRKCIPYRAPSWSWASVECPIIYPILQRTSSPGCSETDETMKLQVIDCSVSPRSILLPLGKATGGRLRVLGDLVGGVDVPMPERWQPGTFAGGTADVVLKLDCYAMEDKAAISKAQSCWWLRIQHTYGLILELVDGDIYRRIGCVVIKDWSKLQIVRRVIDII
ncbi:HET-domain-containing protein [Xylariaceae sp. AK1471]|nr:HET-domain-containing protein [Xylariaceae sp. AK1471]